jgi:CRISPR type III-A-associated protein Csm2
MGNGYGERRGPPGQGGGRGPGGHGGDQGRRDREGRRDDAAPQVDKAFVDDVLSGDGEKIVRRAEELARQLERLARAQIRNFYGPVIKLRESERSPKEQISRLHLMRARLAYMVARPDGRAAGPLRSAFDALVRAVTEEELPFLYDFAEAVVAYHRGISKN